MNPDKAADNESEMNPAHADVEATLRLVATLPAPEGLEDRVHAALRVAPRAGRVLSWPARFGADGPWMRGAAAAAIAFAVVGGGWEVYSRVQPARVIVMPPHVGAPGGGFSNAGAMRTPQTLNGPVINHPAATKPAVAAVVPHVVAMPARHGETAPVPAK